jgi:hypothetical protein
MSLPVELNVSSAGKGDDQQGQKNLQNPHHLRNLPPMETLCPDR